MLKVQYATVLTKTILFRRKPIRLFEIVYRFLKVVRSFVV